MSIIISKDCAAFVTESVTAFFSAENSEVATGRALVMALDPSGERNVTLEHFEAVQEAWCNAYKLKRGGKVSSDAITMAWSRALALTKTEQDPAYTRPKATTKGAVKKAASREDAKKAIALVVEQYKGDAAAIADKAASALKNGDAKTADIFSKAAQDVIKRQAAEAKKATDDAIKAKRSILTEIIKKADLALLERLIEAATADEKPAKKTRVPATK